MKIFPLVAILRSRPVRADLLRRIWAVRRWRKWTGCLPALGARWSISSDHRGIKPYGIEFQVIRPILCDERYNLADTGKGTSIKVALRHRHRPPGPTFSTAQTKLAHGGTAGQNGADRIIHGYAARRGSAAESLTVTRGW